MNYDNILKLFVLKDKRDACHHPATFGDFVFATDRHIMVRIPKQFIEGTYPRLHRHPDMTKINLEPSGVLGKIHISKIEAALSKVELVDDVEDCTYCNGRGYQECNLGHEHECEACKGTGCVESKTKEKVLSEIDNISILNRRFNPRHIDIIRKAMKECGEDEVTIVRDFNKVSEYKYNPMLFAFKNFIVALMTITDQSTDGRTFGIELI